MRRRLTYLPEKWLTCLLVFLSPLLLASCVTLSPVVADDPAKVYLPADEDNLLASFAPLFVPQTYQQNHNRIGKPSIRSNGHTSKDEEVFIDASEAVMYAEQRTFSSITGDYTNLIYRIHFEGVPFQLIPFHVTAGKNAGLLVILTLNSNKQPVLVTTVHTCGCYCVTTPTSYLPQQAYPDEWRSTAKELWGETLPGTLDYPLGTGEKKKLLVFLRDDTHRVMDLQILTEGEIHQHFVPLPIRLEPLASLKAIPVQNGATSSFFEEEGWRKGFVKGSYKPWEMLMISWWALDLNVGCDKEYGDPRTSDTTFYTSLKPWYRSESDMRDFAGFLHFWGWKL